VGNGNIPLVTDSTKVIKKLLEKSEGLEKVFSKNITKSNGRFIVFCRDVEHMNRMILLKLFVMQYYYQTIPQPYFYSHLNILLVLQKILKN